MAEEQRKRRTPVATSSVGVDDDSPISIGLWSALGVSALVILLTLAGVFGWCLGGNDASNNGTNSAVAAQYKGYNAGVNAGANANDNIDVNANGSGFNADASDEAGIIVENGVVKFYFATGGAELAPNAEQHLQEIIEGVKAGKKAVISGFADRTGDVKVNEELSKQRALAVRDTLIALGVSENSIEMRKPQEITGTGSNAEARRVEVFLE